MSLLRLGLIGHPVKHSLSPPMHRAALSFFELDGSYELLDIEPERLEAELGLMKERGFSGFNVTIPHKEAVSGLLQDLSPEAQLVGAVNTVRIDSAGLFRGHNTDLSGFMQAVSRICAERLEFNLDSVLLLGAGGAARACLAGLMLLGCRRLVVAARRTAEAGQLCQSLRNALLSCAAAASGCGIALRQEELSELQVEVLAFERIGELGPYSLIVNCTPIGLHEEAAELPWLEQMYSSLTGGGLLFDTVYRPDRKPTFLMENAIARGITAVDGLNMLAGQALLSFEYWTCRRPAFELMFGAIRD